MLRCTRAGLPKYLPNTGCSPVVLCAHPAYRLNSELLPGANSWIVRCSGTLASVRSSVTIDLIVVSTRGAVLEQESGNSRAGPGETPVLTPGFGARRTPGDAGDGFDGRDQRSGLPGKCPRNVPRPAPASGKPAHARGAAQGADLARSLASRTRGRPIKRRRSGHSPVRQPYALSSDGTGCPGRRNAGRPLRPGRTGREQREDNMVPIGTRPAPDPASIRPTRRRPPSDRRTGLSCRAPDPDPAGREGDPGMPDIVP